ncbi:hypothetical protein CBM2589_A91045 [Cupriavidus taiwanensis]|uniref:Uncharacterized protein n=1 Tax=Cupriavidus taiwanensis TaxID=164546 RepID=A0A976A9Y5_9BURK|nr:hypothetical protein CBM2589_A91045 [Cupriavidus taiwanensis]
MITIRISNLKAITVHRDEPGTFINIFE